MRTIWKYELRLVDVQRIAMPQGAELLVAAGQHVEQWSEVSARNGTFPMLWALVDPDAIKVDRLIAVVGTGSPAPEVEDNAVYVGSAVCGPFVWHVFDGGEA